MSKSNEKFHKLMKKVTHYEKKSATSEKSHILGKNEKN